MADLHDALLISFRKKILKAKFRESRNPMPEFRPDYFGRNYSADGKIIKEIVVEAEIKATLYSEHTSRQLVLMDEYLAHRRKKKIVAIGYLLIPKNKEMISLGTALLESLFPIENKIELIQI